MESGRSPFGEWFNGLDAVTAARVDKYIRRLEAGNFGAAKALQDGIFELRLDFGPGYRIYYGITGRVTSSCWEAGANGDKTPTLPRQ